MSITYLAVIEAGEPGEDFSVFFPDVPGCVSAGATIAEAINGAHEALSLHIEGLEEDNDTIPEPEFGGRLKEYKQAVSVAAVSVELADVIKKFTLTLPQNLVERVDAVAGSRGRSSFFAEAGREKLRKG